MYPFRPLSLIDGGIAIVLVISDSGARCDRAIVWLEGNVLPLCRKEEMLVYKFWREIRRRRQAIT